MFGFIQWFNKEINFFNGVFNILNVAGHIKFQRNRSNRSGDTNKLVIQNRLANPENSSTCELMMER